MQKSLAVSLLAGAVLFATGQATAATSSKENTQQEAYAVGLSMSQSLAHSLKQQAKIGLTLDKDQVIKGFKDGLNGKEKLSSEEMTTALKSLSQRMGKLQAAKAAKDAAKAKKEGEKFLKANAKKPGVKTTASGLQYKILKKGSGPHPKKTDLVTVDYKGTLIDGTKFDSSYDRGKPVTFQLDQVIPGWTEGVQLMRPGSKYRFFIPAKLAYKDRAMRRIPGNSSLIFDVELHKIKHPEKKADAQKAAQ